MAGKAPAAAAARMRNEAGVEGAVVVPALVRVLEAAHWR